MCVVPNEAPSPSDPEPYVGTQCLAAAGASDPLVEHLVKVVFRGNVCL